jgi:hypothetical protein
LLGLNGNPDTVLRVAIALAKCPHRMHLLHTTPQCAGKYDQSQKQNMIYYKP